MTILLRKENTKRKSGGRDYLADGKDEKEVEALGDVRYYYTSLDRWPQDFTLTYWYRPDFIYTL